MGHNPHAINPRLSNKLKAQHRTATRIECFRRVAKALDGFPPEIQAATIQALAIIFPYPPLP